jgi:hypothetical protein
MNLLSQFKHIFFILLGILSLQACNNKTADGTGSAPGASSKITAAPASDKDGWIANLNDAYAQSVKDHKPILVYLPRVTRADCVSS